MGPQEVVIKKFPDVYHGAVQIIRPSDFSAGSMDGAPLGVTIHHLGQRDVQKAMEALLKEKLGYHAIIDRDGSFIQTAYFSSKVNHAGKASWNKVSPNKRHLGIAIASWGAVTKHPTEFKYKSWCGTRVPLFDVSLRKGNVDNDWHFWDMATEKQEETLLQFLVWAMKLGIDPKNICGHDECALPFGRKNDPGGVLSMTMSQLRSLLMSAR